jgi:hypothetical protein
MVHAKWLGACLVGLVGLGTLNQADLAAAQGQVPLGYPTQPMYSPYTPMVGASYLSRRAYRTGRFHLATSATLWIDPAGAPGTAPSWSTLRAGLDRYPLLGGVEVPQAPAFVPGAVDDNVAPPVYQSAPQPTPAPAIAQPSGPNLSPPTVNPPAPAQPTPAAPASESNGPKEF